MENAVLSHCPIIEMEKVHGASMRETLDKSSPLKEMPAKITLGQGKEHRVTKAPPFPFIEQTSPDLQSEKSE